MTAAAHKKNLVGGIVSLVALALVLLSAITSEGSYLCISKAALGVIATSLWPIYRLVGEVVRRNGDAT